MARFTLPVRRSLALVASVALLALPTTSVAEDQPPDDLAFGGAPDLGRASLATDAPTVGIAGTPDGGGYYEVTSSGEVLPFGSATYAGDAEDLVLGGRVVGIAADPDGEGYWLAGADGGVFSYEAAFPGSVAHLTLRAPVVGVASPSSQGVWLVAADGGVFALGDAPFLGAALGRGVPAVGIAATTSGRGYAVAFADGSVRGFGDATTSPPPAARLAAPIVGVASDPDGDGLWLAAADGGVFAIDAAFHGSAGGTALADRPVVGIAADRASGGYWLARGGRAAATTPCLDQVFPMADVLAGMPVRALATDRGRTPAPLTGAVVGVIEDGIAPAIDIIVVELDSPALRAAGGIWFGMSGSPVYAADGRLLGAISYVMAWGPAPQAGLTPAEALVRGLASTPTSTKAATSAGMVPLVHPVTVSGADAHGIDLVSKQLEASGLASPLIRRGAAAPLQAAGGSLALSPGMPVAMAVSYGDSTIASVGTVTMVCGSTAYAFGHPWSNGGRISASAHAADIVYVQPDAQGGAYAIANIGPAIGTVTDDRLVGLRIDTGAIPTGARVTSQVLDRESGRSRRGSTVAHDVQGSLTSAVVNHVYLNLLAASLSQGEATIDLRWTLQGRVGDRELTLTRGNRFSGRAWVADQAAWDLVTYLDALVTLNPHARVRVDAIDIVGSVSETSRESRIAQVQVDQGAGWVVVGSEDFLTLDPGTDLKVRVELRPPQGAEPSTWVELIVPVPPGSDSASGSLEVVGGAGERWIDPTAYDSLSELLDALAAQPRNDDLSVTLDLPGVAEVRRTHRHSSVVSGAVYVPVGVTGGEEPEGPPSLGS
jgi:hypothetical protein